MANLIINKLFMMKNFLFFLLSIAALNPFLRADIWTDLAQYEMGDNADAAPAAVNERVLQTPPEQMGPIEDKLIVLLESPSATSAAKQYAFRLLDRIGTDASVPAVTRFLSDEKLGLFARRTLEGRPDSQAAGQALLAALPQVEDALKIGILGSLAERGDRSVISSIAPYASSKNIALAKAAIFALGELGGAKAHEALVNATVSRDLADPRAAEILAAAKNIKDSGSFYHLSRSVEPVGGSYVQFDGKEGWQGEYFNGKAFTGPSDLMRQDRAPYFNWKQGSPGPEINNNNFVVRWIGTLTPPESRLYEFNIDSDDGVQVRINGEAIFDNLRGAYKGTTHVELMAGVGYPVEVLFIEGGGDARCQFTWDCALPETISAGRQKILNAPIAEQQRSLLAAQAGVDVTVAQRIFEMGTNPSIRLEAFNQLAILDIATAEAALDEALSDPSDPIRQSLIRAVMENGTRALQDQLVATLASTTEADQLTLLGAIQDLRLRQYESAVLPLLKSSKGMVFEQTAFTLGSIGKEASFKQLYEAFQKEENAAITFAITQLQLPAVDEHLLSLVSGQSGGNLESRLAGITPLVLRNPEGAAAVFNDLVAKENPEIMRKAGLKAIEAAGDVESCKVLVGLIVGNDSMKRQAQQTLKKSALRLDKAHDVWNEAFKPTLTSKNIDQATKESLLVIIDGVPTGDSLNYLNGIIRNREDPLRSFALRALQKWPNSSAGAVWIEIAKTPGATSKEVSMALKGITRILTREEIERNANRKLLLALKAVQEGPSLDFKLEVLASLEGAEDRVFGRMEEHFKPIINDPEVGAAVQALMKRK